MAFTQFAVQTVSPSKSGAVTYSAVDAVNGNAVPNPNGALVILVKNGSGAGITVTVASVADYAGRTGDQVIAVAAGEERFIGLMDPGLWDQQSVDPSEVHVSFSAGTSVTMAAIQLR